MAKARQDLLDGALVREQDGVKRGAGPTRVKAGDRVSVERELREGSHVGLLRERVTHPDRVEQALGHGILRYALGGLRLTERVDGQLNVLERVDNRRFTGALVRGPRVGHAYQGLTVTAPTWRWSTPFRRTVSIRCRISSIPWPGGTESDKGIGIFASRSFGSYAQKAFILKQEADVIPVAEIRRRAGISQATYFNWKKYDGLLPTEVKRLMQLEDESVNLRKLVADLSLGEEMLQDVIRRKL